jgi:4-hydroxy-3-methylbut-2-enyl diphosphate reductase
MGVRRALEMVLAEVNKGKSPIYTYGPLIHNEQVMELLASKGVQPVEDFNGLEGTLLIRAHGISPQERKKMKATGLQLLDATCPRVAKVQSIIRKHTRKGYTALIVGDHDHPEVIGLMGFGQGRTHVLNSVAHIPSMPECEHLIVVAQTTQDDVLYREIVNKTLERFPQALVFDTICDATHRRQEEVRTLSNQVDGMVVVGGYHSGNTARLAHISKATGLPTFHIEKEDNLDKKALGAMEVVGVTAGASTPNWLINNVVREIERIRSRKESRFLRWLRRVLKTLFLSNMVVALGSFFLAYAVGILSKRDPGIHHPLIVALYIYAMHVLNRFLDKGASAYNDPAQAQFYNKHRLILILTGIAAIVGALVLSYHLAPLMCLTIAGFSVLGMIYSIPILAVTQRPRWQYAKIKDIPGSKTLFGALAWGSVIALVPLMEPFGTSLDTAILTFLFVFSLVYVKSALFDIIQVQGDLIVGKETLPIILGEKRTFRLLKRMLLFIVALLVAGPLLHIVRPLSYALVLCPLFLALTLRLYEKRWLYPGIRLEAMVEGPFFLAGLLAVLWQKLPWPL